MRDGRISNIMPKFRSVTEYRNSNPKQNNVIFTFFFSLGVDKSRSECVWGVGGSGKDVFISIHVNYETKYCPYTFFPGKKRRRKAHTAV